MPASPRRLRDACERGDLRVVRDELSKGVDVNHSGAANQWTALHRAAARGRVDVVQLLLQVSAPAHARHVA